MDYLRTLGIDPDTVNINVEYVTSSEIQKFNNKYRNKNKPTDVLSFPLLDIRPGQIPTPRDFPFDVNPETGKIELGDVLICTEIAAIQAREKGHSLEHEIAFLLVHGVLHLVGYTHESDADEKLMNELTEQILKAGKR